MQIFERQKQTKVKVTSAVTHSEKLKSSIIDVWYDPKVETFEDFDAVAKLLNILKMCKQLI